MDRKIIFKGGSTELVLPVTPESYQVENGINIEVVNIHGLGDAILTGYGTLATIKLSCIFPAQDYAFARSSDPDRYIDRFNRWVESKTRLRFVVSGTGINLPVVVQSFSYGERDGSNDVYADLILREYRKLQAVKTVTPPTANKPRERAEVPLSSLPESYQMQPGDTAGSISKRFLGSTDFADLLAKAAGVQKDLMCMAVGKSTINIREVAQSIPGFVDDVLTRVKDWGKGT